LGDLLQHILDIILNEKDKKKFNIFLSPFGYIDYKSLQEADIGNNNNGSDLNVAFDKAADETRVSEYRIIVVQTPDAATFDLDAANAVSSANYKSVLPSGSNHSSALSTTAKDKDGNLIIRGISYKVFVLHVADGTNANINSLKVSNELTLHTPAHRAQNVKAFDVWDHNDGSDMEVSFDKAVDESTVIEYRIIVVKSADAPGFKVNAASAVTAGNYTSITPNGSDVTQTMAVDAKDKDGDLIVNNVEYVVFILSIADGTIADVNNLSAPSNEVTLIYTGDIEEPNKTVINWKIYSSGNDIYIKTNELPRKEAIVSIYTKAGKEVYKSNLSSSNTMITLDNIVNGIYIVKVQVDNNSIIRKLFIGI